MTSDETPDTDTFGPQATVPQPEQVRAWDSEYLRDLLDCAEPDNWQMVALPTGELIMRGIQPIDGQLMLLSDAITRDLLATRAENARLKAALAEAEAREGRLLRAVEQWRQMSRCSMSDADFDGLEYAASEVEIIIAATAQAGEKGVG